MVTADIKTIDCEVTWEIHDIVWPVDGSPGCLIRLLIKLVQNDCGRRVHGDLIVRKWLVCERIRQLSGNAGQVAVAVGVGWKDLRERGLVWSAHAFISSKEKRLVANDWATRRAAKTIGANIRFDRLARSIFGREAVHRVQ